MVALLRESDSAFTQHLTCARLSHRSHTTTAAPRLLADKHAYDDGALAWRMYSRKSWVAVPEHFESVATMHNFTTISELGRAEGLRRLGGGT